jgi:hypothetical protein
MQRSMRLNRSASLSDLLGCRYAHQLPPLLHKIAVALCLWIEIPGVSLSIF